MLLATVSVQSAVNMFNEYYDFRRGLDHQASVGIGGAIVRDGMTPERVFQIGMALVVFALLLGTYIMQQSSWRLLPWGLGCIAVGYLYSGGPFPISATPFGEVAAGSCMGTGVIAISHFIHTVEVPSFVFLISAAPSVMIGAILMANNIRDFDDDQAYGRKTLAILVGRKRAILVLELMFVFSYLWTVGLVASSQASPWSLLVLFSVPKTIQACRRFHQGTRPDELMPAMVATSQANSAFGFLLALGLMVPSL